MMQYYYSSQARKGLEYRMATRYISDEIILQLKETDNQSTLALSSSSETKQNLLWTMTLTLITMRKQLWTQVLPFTLRHQL